MVRKWPTQATAAALLLTGAASALAAPPARGADDCLVTYQEFEENVKHVDLPRCPGNEIGPESGFCRLSFHGDKVVVYVFEFRKERICLAGARVHSVEAFWK